MKQGGWSGILNIAKPAGITSRDAVNRVQKLVKPLKVGHAGTLDPMATGVLLVCVGAATRLVPYLQEQRKRYRAAFRLGLTTDSDDITGAVLTRSESFAVTPGQLADALQRFVGPILQVPPRVSAVHVAGQRAYDLARKGQEFELQARPVEVYSLNLLAFAGDEFRIEMDCSSGTYVRSIGRDVGELLGCGATMTELERTAIGAFTVEQALSADELDRQTLSSRAWPLLEAVREFPRVALSEDELIAVRCGRTCAKDLGAEVADGADVALLNAVGELIGIGAWQLAERRLQPRIVFPAETL